MRYESGIESYMDGIIELEALCYKVEYRDTALSTPAKLNEFYQRKERLRDFPFYTRLQMLCEQAGLSRAQPKGMPKDSGNRYLENKEHSHIPQETVSPMGIGYSNAEQDQGVSTGAKKHETPPLGTMQSLETVQVEGIQRENKDIGQKKDQQDISLYPTTKDIVTYYKSRGVVGEEGTALLLTYGALARQHMGIESFSGSGKSVLLYALTGLLSRVYPIQQASHKAFFHDPDINTYDFLVISELQKVDNPSFLEIIKTLSEGQDALYLRTNNAQNGIERITISAGKTIIYTLAITNKYYQRMDEELARRFAILNTSASAEQTRLVVEHLAEQRPRTSAPSNQLKAHVKNCLDLQSLVVNPYLPYVVSLVPESFTHSVRMRSAIGQLSNFICGRTLFHYSSRYRKGGNIFTQEEDVTSVLQLYEQSFMDSLLGMSVLDRAVLSSLSEPQEMEQIYAGVNAQMKVKISSVTSSLESLIDSGLAVAQGKKYARSGPQDKFAPWDSEIARQSATQFMHEKFSAIAEEWAPFEQDKRMEHG